MTMGFEEALLDVFTSGDQPIAGPDPVTIIQNKKGTCTLCSLFTKEIYVFSSKEKADAFIKEADLSTTAITTQILWNELVDQYPQYSRAIINPMPDCIPESIIPLQKNI